MREGGKVAGDMSSLAWPMCFWETVRCHYEVTTSSLLLSTDSWLLSQAVMQPGWAAANVVCFHGKSAKDFWLKELSRLFFYSKPCRQFSLHLPGFGDVGLDVCHHFYETLHLSQTKRKGDLQHLKYPLYFVLGYSLLFTIPFNPLHLYTNYLV